MKTLNAKLMHDKLKLGWTAIDFANHLEITVDKFWDSLERQFTPTAYKHMKSDLQANEKHPRHKKNRNSDVESSATEIISEQISEIPVVDETSEETSAFSLYTSDEEEICVENSEDIEEKTEITEVTLEELKNQRHTLIVLQNTTELEHKEIVSQRVQIRNAISTHRDALVELQQLVQQHQQGISELLLKLDDTANAMEVANSKIAECREKIAEIDVKIEKLQKVTVFVYATGEIEFCSSASVEIPEWSDLFDEIIKEDELDSLTIKQMKALAKVIVLAKFLGYQKRSCEVFFDDATSENYFKKVIS